MLVLDRKVQEGFWIDERIFVKVLGIGRRRVKLGIQAPSDLKVVRDELWSRPARETPGESGLSLPEEQPTAERSFRSARRRN